MTDATENSQDRAGLTNFQLASYSALTMPMAAMGMPIAVYLPRFYSEGLGLSLVTVGLIFTLARIWDVVTDPLMGVLIDKYDTRWGRRKHWIALSIPLLVVSVWMVFLPNPNDVSGLYLTIWLILLYIGYTMLVIAHLSWGAELSASYDDRSRLFGWREIFTIAGMLIVLAIPAFLEQTGHDDQIIKVGSMGLFCIIFFPLLAVLTLRYVPDSRAAPVQAIPWREAVAVVLGNQMMWRVLIADLASGFGVAVSGALYIFVASFYFELPSHASIALLFYFLSSFVAMPMWLKLAYSIGKDSALKVALIYGVVANLLLIPLAEPGSVAVLWGFTIVYGIAFGAAPTLLRSMMADLTDYDELQSKQKRGGLFFALLTTTNKLGAAIGVGASFTVLEVMFGFVPGAQNSQTAIDGLLYTYVVGTVLGLFIAALPLFGYPLNKGMHDDILAKLRARATQSAQAG